MMRLKNITLSADEKLIELARKKAIKEKKTLNGIFREWLAIYTGNFKPIKNYQKLMTELNYVKVGRRFTRDELNER